jgi:hypothetical protein
VRLRSEFGEFRELRPLDPIGRDEL